MEAFRRTPLLLSLLLSLLSTATATSFIPNISIYIDCGAKDPITLSKDSPPRIFNVDDSYLQSDKNTLSLSNPNNSSSGSLYSTARVSSSSFTYKFNNMDPNTFNVLRLHFLPFSAPSYELSTAKFSVHALNYILLDNFTVADTASPTIKEFFLWTESSDMEVQFIPQSNSIAFVSAIEAFIAPQEMLNSSNPKPIGDPTLSVDLVKQVLETVYRVNMPGPLITPHNDTLWRTWVTDDPYIYSADGSKKTSVSTSLTYVPSQGSSEEIAPPTVYNTARSMNLSEVQFISNPGFNINITWSFSVDSGYHLIRLHFCDIISETNSLDQGLVFTVYIMNYSALTNNLRISDYTTYSQEPFYIDFIAHVMSAQNITVSISMDRTDSKIRNAFLNGLEIFKVNNLTTKKNHPAVILGATIGGVIVIALILSCIVVVSIKKRHQKRTPDVKETHLLWSPMTRGVNSIDNSSKSGGATTIGASPRVDLGLLISLAQIKMATDNFDEKNQIGVGGFGKVYKGVLSNGVKVAVKRASSRSQQGFPEFQTEIEVLSQIRHRHLVSLIGYCDERSEMILVYEYMEKGPLRNYLYGNESPSLSWKQRLEICIEAAKGLHYLHTGYSQTIIHRDVKSTNILLGEGYSAKVSDFGLSKLGASIGETHVSTAVKGTFGYLDPEYFKTQKLTDKSDVYSFGVTLLEVLCARPVIDQSLAREEINLAEWALMWLSQGQLEKIIDPRLVGEINENSLRKFGEIAEKCLQEYGMDRPAIGDVLWNLEYCLQLQETEVRREPYEDSGTSEAHFPAVPFVRRMPSSVVSHETATSGDSRSDITNSNVFSQLISGEGR
ncbi:receptor-like protein kinase HERK 1 [Carex littledalei]|uniref:Receptor-like protein kinase HERK 1 n=1 Tax=Carex littledalei TaxID=544730 RepID=A0A833UZH1_9POAL|nr:receptor-like protein kinase HERK 1 [Carex littledalei]